MRPSTRDVVFLLIIADVLILPTGGAAMVIETWIHRYRVLMVGQPVESQIYILEKSNRLDKIKMNSTAMPTRQGPVEIPELGKTGFCCGMLFRIQARVYLFFKGYGTVGLPVLRRQSPSFDQCYKPFEIG
jgi:hypothetical protein